MGHQKDIQILRDLASTYLEIAMEDRQQELRELWRKHNSLVKTRPLVLMRLAGAAWNEIPEVKPQCEDPFYRQHEGVLRRAIYNRCFEDDTVLEPWIIQPASRITPPEGRWGVRIRHIHSNVPGGAWKFDPPLRELEDSGKLVEPHHQINEETTARNAERLVEALGDILVVVVDRSPAYKGFAGDLSTDLAHLRGLEQVMWDMVENPDWLHEVLAFMRDGVLNTHHEAEQAGDWHLCNHSNQSVPYSLELDDPKPNGGSVTRGQLWGFMAAQEMAQVSPQMHDEFMLQYQMPIMAQFGLIAYGCCEDLTHKIEYLRNIPNLRRIAVTPSADVRRNAEQIGGDYVCSWRPNPSEMLCCGFDPNYVRQTVADAMAAFGEYGCHVDITLKDVQTIQHQPENAKEWVRIVRSTTEDYL